MRGIEHRGLTLAEGPIVIAERRESSGYGELAAVYGRDGKRRLGKVIDVSDKIVAIGDSYSVR